MQYLNVHTSYAVNDSVNSYENLAVRLGQKSSTLSIIPANKREFKIAVRERTVPGIGSASDFAKETAYIECEHKELYE